MTGRRDEDTTTPADTWSPPDLTGLIAVVTGASRGVGRGIAVALGACGATVYVTGRTTRGSGSPSDRAETIDETAELLTARGGTGIAVRCDHTIDQQIEALFDRVRRDHGRIDLLVNNAWGGYEIMVDFTPFWKLDLRQWTLMFQAGLRATMITSRLALPLMLPAGRGLIVNTTSPVGEKYHGHVFYDTVKTALNRMTFGMAHDLREHSIAAVSLAPGWTRTERIHAHYETDETNWQRIRELESTHSPEFVGRAVAALASSPDIMERTGEVLDVADLASEHDYTDTDGRHIRPFRELREELLD